MTTQNHPIAAEELMAYLDGELAPEQARAAATHLEACTECQKLAADLRGVSQAMNMWELDASGRTLPRSLAAALGEHIAEPQPALMIPMPWYRRLQFRKAEAAFATSAAVAILVVGVRLIGRNANTVFSSVDSATQESRYSAEPAPAHPPAAGPVRAITPSTSAANANGLYLSDQQSNVAGGVIGGRVDTGDRDRLDKSAIATKAPVSTTVANLLPTGPMIIRTAELSLTSREFDKGRTQVEDILKRHHGYVGTLHVTNVGSGRTLTASLRIPSADLDAALAELKILGRLTSESKTGQEVTAQYVDLQARLANSRNTEQRLIELLRNRTGKLSDVLEVENELARVRGEVESMEAERKTLSNQVALATLNLTLTEDFRAQLQVVPPSTSTRLINAAVDGNRSMVDGLMSVALFFLSSGPTLLVWTAILFLPARFAWRRFRRSVA